MPAPHCFKFGGSNACFVSCFMPPSVSRLHRVRYCAIARNPEYHRIDNAYLDDPRHCPLDRSNLLQKHDQPDSFNISDFMAHAGFWLLASAAGMHLQILLELCIHDPHAEPSPQTFLPIC